MSNELLTLKNLKQYFPVGKDRFVRAVDGVDLTINHGDVMGLVGESWLRKEHDCLYRYGHVRDDGRRDRL